MILQDIFVFFSRFVSRKALDGIFIKSDNSFEYSDIRDKVYSIPFDNRMEEITDYIFGIDEDSVRERISSVKGTYLFVDYGNITSDISQLDVNMVSARISVTIATPLPDGCDQVSKMLAQDRALDMLSYIRAFMREQDGTIVWLESGSSTISPFVAKGLANSYGYSFDFNVESCNAL